MITAQINLWIYALFSVIFVSILSLTGIVLFLGGSQISKNRLLLLVSFSVGGLLGGAFLHLLPESIETIGIEPSINYLLFGILASFFVEMFLKWRHCHIPTTDDHPHTFAYMNLIGDGVHNFIDGIIIGASYLQSIDLGIASTIAICMHEIPQEVGDYGVLLYAGYSKKRALLLNILSASSAILGLGLFMIVGTHMKQITSLLIPFAAGNFIYIAGSDLVPELHDVKEIGRSLMHLVSILVGLALLFFLKNM